MLVAINTAGTPDTSVIEKRQWVRIREAADEIDFSISFVFFVLKFFVFLLNILRHVFLLSFI